MSFRRRNREGDTAAAWISLADVFLIIALFSIGLTLGVFGASRLLDEEREELERLREEVPRLRTKVAEIEADLAERDVVIEAQEQRIGQLLGQLVDAGRTIDALDQKIGDLEDERDAWKRKYSTADALAKRLDREVRRLKKLLEEERAKRGTIHQELLGIHGPMKRVLFLFDCSDSMFRTSENAAVDRWKDAKRTAEAWLRHLPVEKAALILFGEKARPGRRQTVRAYPSDGTLLDLLDGQTRRSELIHHLNTVRPGGETNTFDALQLAFTYRHVDTILLFTDGAPSTSGEPRDHDATFMTQIHEFLAAKRKERGPIPINTIGLGHYFSGPVGPFLVRIASDSGGGFVGR